jgi:transcriptional regulator with XRE-family HTH domain
MTISEKIFELLRERGMTQKEFAQATGIAESSISDWKRKKTNPVSEKILIICEVLGYFYALKEMKS